MRGVAKAAGRSQSAVPKTWSRYEQSVKRSRKASKCRAGNFKRYASDEKNRGDKMRLASRDAKRSHHYHLSKRQQGNSGLLRSRHGGWMTVRKRCSAMNHESALTNVTAPELLFDVVPMNRIMMTGENEQMSRHWRYGVAGQVREQARGTVITCRDVHWLLITFKNK